MKEGLEKLSPFQDIVDSLGSHLNKLIFLKSTFSRQVAPPQPGIHPLSVSDTDSRGGNLVEV